MKLFMLRVCLLSCATLLFPSASAATRLGSDTEAPPQRLALLIGNSAYAHVNSLKNPKNDVDQLAAKLKTLGFQTDVQYDLDHDQFVDALSSFQNKIEPGGIALFYYSGHGTQLGGTNYLIPINMASGANAVTVQGSGISLTLVRNALSNAKLSLIVLDACRSSLNLAAKGPVEGLAAFVSRGALIAYAADEGQAASDNDSEDLSLFTKHLINELDKHDETLCQLFGGIRAAVDEASGHVQFPFVYDGVIGDFVFNRTTTRESEELAFVSKKVGGSSVWTKIKDSENPNDFAAYLAPRGWDNSHASIADDRLSALMSSTAKAAGVVPLGTQEPPEITALANQGERLFYEGAYTQASIAYEKLIAARPSSTAALYDYATCLLHLGRYDDAIQLFSKTADTDPKFPWSHFNRGVAHHLKGNFTEAIADYDRAVELRPNFALGYNNLALAKRDAGDLTGAQYDAQKAVALDPHYAPAFFNSAKIWAGLGDTTTAYHFKEAGKKLAVPQQF